MTVYLFVHKKYLFVNEIGELTLLTFGTQGFCTFEGYNEPGNYTLIDAWDE